MTEPSNMEISLGSFLFTLVEPERGYERAYNRWYERDHFYAGCMIGPWQFAGARYVATRAEKALVSPSENPVTQLGRRGSYLGLFWVLDGHHDEWNRWAVDQVNWLHANGRMNPHREHVHTALYNRAMVVARDDDPVPVELALDHRFAGLVAVVGLTPNGVDHQQAQMAMRAELEASLAGTEVALVLHGTPRPLLGDAPGDVPRAPDEDRRFVQLFFLDTLETAAWSPFFATLAERYVARGAGEILWMSPFRPTVVGTDTYTDELWLD